MKRTVQMAMLLALLSGCTSSTEAARALSGAGYTDIRFTGYAWFACGKDDAFATGFDAKGPSGKRVTGAVCSGWLKGATIRMD